MPERLDTTKKVNKKKVIALSAVILFLVIALVLVVVRSNSPAIRVRKQLELAQRYLENLDYEQAIASYEAAIEIDPMCDEAYLSLANIYVELNDPDSAIAVLKTGLEKTGSDSMKQILEQHEASLVADESKSEKE